jgi:hypothetical protein
MVASPSPRALPVPRGGFTEDDQEALLEVLHAAREVYGKSRPTARPRKKWLIQLAVALEKTAHIEAPLPWRRPEIAPTAEASR